MALAIVSASGVDHCRLGGEGTGDGDGEGGTTGLFDVVCHLFATETATAKRSAQVGALSACLVSVVMPCLMTDV